LAKRLLTSLFVVLLGASAAMAQHLQVAATIAFTEGPTADAEGNVFFTDQANNRIMKLAVDGKLSTFRQPANFANGMVFDARFRLLVCESGDPAAGTRPRVTRTDLKTGSIEILAEGYEGKRFAAPNDITFDGQGRIYFSDKPPVASISAAPVAATSEPVGNGGVYRIDTDGRVTRILGPPEIYIFSPTGALLKFIPVPEDTVTNCAFGGSDLKTLYVTAGKSLFKVRTEVEGTRR